MSIEYKFKLVVLGESSVGKSSILGRFLKQQHDDNMESTIGAAFHCQRVVRKDNLVVKLDIWGKKLCLSLLSICHTTIMLPLLNQ